MPIVGVQQIQTFRTKLPSTINPNYLLYLPKEYNTDQSKRWPLILFLHGAGERGSNLELVKAHGVPKLVEQYPDLHFPFIVVSPQCSLDATWSSRVLGRVLDEVVREYHVDRDRIYVTGLSMGGLGTWALAIAHPRRFAAIAPICGGGDPSHICAIKHLPVWAFHGAKDTGVPIEYTEVMVQALHECGGNVRFTIYPDAEHDSWTETYNNPELYRWFLEHRRT